ncbi:MAG: phosphate acyltransferase PlsX [Caulobacteraceae bacterium]|nr:phosphate acyltransferase PlsX [Caulobacteraceae bacterium]
MSPSLVISIDAMGGDHGPSILVPGVARAAETTPDLRFLLHGDQTELEAAAAKCKPLQGRCEIRHTERVIGMDEKAAQAMRRGKGTSMWNAIETVKSGEAAAAVSAGNTGALMAISKLQLRTVGEVRPPLVVDWPGEAGVTTVLDVGANVDCDAKRLLEYAIMGEAYHRAVHGVARPTIGILNVGAEDQKGHEDVREAHRLLRENDLGLDYRGFVEGSDFTKGVVNVIVTDGFTGNVALKTAEGTARFILAELRAALTSSLMSKAGALLASGPLKTLRDKLSPDPAAPLLGLNGLVVKSHGSATSKDFAGAVRLAANLARSDFAAEIDRNMKRLTAAVAADEAAPAAEGVSE